ncbi:hypothetical protein SPRG_01702 [Saprolegnia parasitica CBS 223.65]|uniref:C2 domain-containing protein n=1 Tax=Saprolegnia parasitica (strain CBS 223.65) TaxID=695850 RepID=A0A067CTJ5_SAPPC|nr:hypothetical protein SPRG_01702 [Saprolegnia parasitica CBS 223.65]KDO33823.1 hypothetical protein SPRG_01702 [Saprolegnia parasitica CBS 223.65]|eukprot:XP_012195459.1 hypothetical protein SPRG_01702 [Saprolegnia parasitica CBS 223.65]
MVAGPHRRVLRGVPRHAGARRLCVALEKATNLPAADPDLNTSDPYVLITLGQHQWQSPLVRETLHPVWRDQMCEFLVTDDDVTAHPELVVYVNDLDTLRVEDALGVARFPLADWTGATQIQDAKIQAYPLQTHQDTPSSAQIHLSLCFEGWVASFPVVVWENERWLPGSNKWSKDNLAHKFGDRLPWTGPEHSAVLFKDAIPPIPSAFQTKGAWQFDVRQGDNDGWLYASSFRGPWKTRCTRRT